MARKWIVLALAAVMLISSSVLLNQNPIPRVGLPGSPGGEDVAVFATGGGDKLQLAFSKTGHFYSEKTEVAVFASIPGAKIYYTIDGSEPASPSGEYSNSASLLEEALKPVNPTKEYSEPLQLLMPVNDNISVVTLKAIAVYEDEVTRPLVHTYFIGRNIDNRFDTLIFSISTNSEYLYDYDTGIFTEGRLRDDFVRENPRKNIEPPDPANYNWRGREGERPAYVETFTRDGERVVAQAIGIRAHGGWSRSASQKSIRLIARREYEPDFGKFHFDFFPDDTVNDGYGTPLTKYDQLVLRNGANDRDFGMLRHEVGCELARQAGLRDTTPVRPAAVFLNGEYYGFSWVNVRFNEQYLQDVYNAPTSDFQIVGKGELWIDDSAGPEEREAVEHLNSYCWEDLTSDRVFAEFEALVDVDNLLLYYAFETYMGNNDWPQNNLKRWRYTGPREEGLAPELDGRWRYVVFDLDWTLGLYEGPSNPKKPTWAEMTNENHHRYSHMLAALLKRPELADKFSMIICDLAANLVTEENVNVTVARLYGESSNEIGAALLARKYSWWVTPRSIQDNHNNMAFFARGRGDYMIGVMRDHFGYADTMYEIKVTGGEAVIGTQKGTSARYFTDLAVPLRPVLPKHTVFDHWVVNGAVVTEPEITVSAADARGAAVNVELVTREELPPLVFQEAYASSERNGCALASPAGETARTAGLYITNDMRNPFLWALPDATVAPGETLELAGKGSASPKDLHLIRMGFTVRQGRMLYLCDEAGTVLDTITAP